MSTKYAILVIADKMLFCGIFGILIIKNLNEGVLILVKEK
jgi:hypothetical protein